MGALEQFKMKMAEKRRARENKQTLSAKTQKTIDDLTEVINTITRTGQRTDLPGEFTAYCRRRYTSIVSSLSFSVDDDFITCNRPNAQQLEETPLSVDICMNDYLTLIYEPKDKSIFVDNEGNENNLRIEKYAGLFQFYDDNCALRFCRKTDELDCKGSDEEENKNAKVLSTFWTVEPYFFKLPSNFLELYISGGNCQAELNSVIDLGIPPDEELISLLNKFLEILISVLYSIKTNLNYYCRITHNQTLRSSFGGKEVTAPISVLQMMEREIEGLNNKGRVGRKPQPVKTASRKPRVKPKPKKRK